MSRPTAEKSATPIPAIAGPWPAMLIAPGILLQGFDNPVGQAVACLLASCALGIVVTSLKPGYAIWRKFISKLCLIGGALVWLLGVACAQWMSDGADGLLLAPDLFAPNFLGILAGFWTLVLCILCGYGTGEKAENIDWIIWIVSLHTILGLLQFSMFFAGMSHDWSVIYRDRFAGLIGNSNVTACVCGVGCVLAWSKVLIKIDAKKGYGDPTWSLRDAIYLLTIAINACAIVLTASRIASLITFLAMMANIMVVSGNRKSSRKFVLALAVAGGAAALLQSQIASQLVDRMANSEADIATRMEIWQHYIRNASAAAWFGFGPGAFSSLNILTMPTDGTGRDFLSINSVHNTALQLLLVGGIPYLVLLLSAAGLIIRDILRSPHWRERDPTLVALALAAGVIPIAGSADIALDMPASIMVFAALAGLAWGRAMMEPAASSGITPPAREARSFA